jgi:hypothetical protein
MLDRSGHETIVWPAVRTGIGGPTTTSGLRPIATLELPILSRPAQPRQSGDGVAMNRA